MKLRRTVGTLAVLLLLLVGGWYFGSPWWTLWQMKKAADARDVARLFTYIDVPAVRQGMETQLRTKLTVPNVVAIIRGWDNRRALDLAELALSGEGMRTIFSKECLNGRDSAPLGMCAADMRVRYGGFNEFRLARRDWADGGLVFARRGIGWQLVDIRIPTERR